MDVEGAFVSTYGFAAYLLAWERMAADTSVARVFELADACAHDLGKVGADADTGLGRLDMGCMASRIYAAGVVVEEKETPAVVPPVTVAIKPNPTVTVTVKPTVSLPEEKEIPEKVPPVTVAIKPSPTVTVAVKPTVSLPEEKEIPEDVPPVTVAIKPSPTVTVAVKPIVSLPEEKEIPEKVPPVTVAIKPSPTVTVAVKPIVSLPEEKEIPEKVPPVTVAIKPSPTVTVAVKPTVSLPEEKEIPEDVSPVTVAIKPSPTVTVAVKPTMAITTKAPQTDKQPISHISTTTTIYLPVVPKPLTVAVRKKDSLNALSKRFVSLGVTVVTSRKANAYAVGGYVVTVTIRSRDNNAGNPDMFNNQIGKNIYDAKRMLSEMGLASESSYTFLDGGKNVSLTHESLYKTTPENSMVYFGVNPFLC